MITLVGTIIKYSFLIEGIEFISALLFVEGIAILLIDRITSKSKI